MKIKRQSFSIFCSELLDNHLDFGDCGIGEQVSVNFLLNYMSTSREQGTREDSGVSTDGGDDEMSSSLAISSNQTNNLPLAFDWPTNHPQLTFEPANGQMLPGQSLSIKATFCSQSMPFRCRFALIECRISRVHPDPPAPPSPPPQIEAESAEDNDYRVSIHA